MGLFDKKFCDVCGEKIGLLGNRKLDDGNLCKTCAGKLSPWFNERRESTVEQIKEQLAYREENAKNLDNFNVTRQYDVNYKVLFDDNNMNFIVSSNSNWKTGNPDIIPFSMLTGCTTDIDETKTEITFEDREGNTKSYNPKKYSYDYYFKVKLFVKHPYFDEISFKINSSSVEEEDPVGPQGGPGMRPGQQGHSDEYYRMADKLDEIKAVFDEIITGQREEAQAVRALENAPKVKVTCPHCGATTIPDANGNCEYCGLSVNK